MNNRFDEVETSSNEDSDSPSGVPLVDPLTSKPNSGSVDTAELLKTLCSQLSLLRLPPPEPSVFTGDVLAYQS